MKHRQIGLPCALLTVLFLLASHAPAWPAVLDLDFRDHGVLRVEVPDGFVQDDSAPGSYFTFRPPSTRQELISFYLMATKPPELAVMPGDEYLEEMYKAMYPDAPQPGLIIESHAGDRPAITIIADVGAVAEQLGAPVEFSGWTVWVIMLFYDKVFTAVSAVPESPEQERDRLLEVMWNAEHWINQ
jgi:hypothetical protein